MNKSPMLIIQSKFFCLPIDFKNEFSQIAIKFPDPNLIICFILFFFGFCQFIKIMGVILSTFIHTHHYNINFQCFSCIHFHWFLFRKTIFILFHQQHVYYTTDFYSLFLIIIYWDAIERLNIYDEKYIIYFFFYFCFSSRGCFFFIFFLIFIFHWIFLLLLYYFLSSSYKNIVFINLFKKFEKEEKAKTIRPKIKWMLFSKSNKPRTHSSTEHSIRKYSI
jgi:hypothetical protein